MDEPAGFSASDLHAYAAEPIQQFSDDDDHGIYAAEHLEPPEPVNIGPAAHVKPPSPSEKRSTDRGNYRLETPQREENNGKRVRLSAIEEVPEEEKRPIKGPYVPEPLPIPIKRKSQFPYTIEDVREKELKADSRFIQAEYYDKPKFPPGEFSKATPVLPPIRRGVGAIDEVDRYIEPERTDNWDRTYQAEIWERPDIGDDLDLTYRIEDREAQLRSEYGLNHSLTPSRRPHFRDLHMTFSPEPIEKRLFDMPLTYTLEEIERENALKITKPFKVEEFEKNALKITKPFKVEEFEKQGVQKLTRPFKLEPIERESRRSFKRSGACSVEPVTKPKPRKHVRVYPFMTEIKTEQKRTRRYDTVARVPQEMRAQGPRRPMNALHTYRVAEVDYDSMGGALPDEFEREFTIDTPQITEVDPDEQFPGLPPDLVDEEPAGASNWFKEPGARFPRVSIPGTLDGSQWSFDTSDTDEQRWEGVSLPGSLASSRGTLKSDGSVSLSGKRDKSKEGNGERWERMSTFATLKGSMATIHEAPEGQEEEPGRLTPYKTFYRGETEVSSEDSWLGEQWRWENVSINTSIKGSQGSFDKKRRTKLLKFPKDAVR